MSKLLLSGECDFNFFFSREDLWLISFWEYSSCLKKIKIKRKYLIGFGVYKFLFKCLLGYLLMELV